MTRYFACSLVYSPRDRILIVTGPLAEKIKARADSGSDDPVADWTGEQFKERFGSDRYNVREITEERVKFGLVIHPMTPSSV